MPMLCVIIPRDLTTALVKKDIMETEVIAQVINWRSFLPRKLHWLTEF